MKLFRILGLSIVVAVTGCASNSSTQEEQWLNPPMAVPLQANVQYEVQVARLTQLLQRSDLENDVRAKMHFERGSYYNSLGLRDLAQLDFNQSLQLNPAQPVVFNQVGQYFTQIGDFDSAYEAFDSSLELDPANSYALRNRSIALYYGDRIPLAIEGMTRYYQESPSDPYRALWLYIISREAGPIDAAIALEKRYQGRNNDWGWILVALMLDKVTEEQAFKAILASSRDNNVLAERLTEVYFYLAKRHQIEGDYPTAVSLYKLAIAQNVYDYAEHKYAFLELTKIFEIVRAEQAEKAKQEQQDSENAQ
ncbi:lipoprotein NlpI [Vibrio hangzhouensis]|uniref:lipoprotein NlpI n=1 Tax=Vibrio hangzhouensis TaxID=462991 RepID=UPI001C97DD46|nr:lipoprotein NlpI [Vibrio hangzhouensis]MBY6197190.1 lipoprotein NlpI [Vibrio hangzhouensis]